MVAIRQRPASCERTSRPIRSSLVSVKRAVIAGAAPRVRVSRAPLTDRLSSTWTCRSASARWRWEVIACRIRATWRVSHTAGGSTISESSASRQLRAAIATAVPTTTVRFDATDVAVEVTTPCMPLMSLVSRDCTSPPRVRVKKPIDWRCRCANRSVRSRCITCWPTAVDSQVWSTPRTAPTTATAIMPPTSASSSVTSCWGSASSMRFRTRNGWASPVTELATMSATMTPRRPRYGANRRAIRASDTGESASCFWSAGSGRPDRPGPRPPRRDSVRSSMRPPRSLGSSLM